jgi:hypothetical protein
LTASTPSTVTSTSAALSVERPKHKAVSEKALMNKVMHIF